MYTNPFNRKHSTIRQVLDRLLDPTRKPIRRSESVSSSGSNASKVSNRSLSGSSHSTRGILQWGRKWIDQWGRRKIQRKDQRYLIWYHRFLKSLSYFILAVLCVSLDRERKRGREIHLKRRSTVLVHEWKEHRWSFRLIVPKKLLVYGANGSVATWSRFV